MLNRLIGLTLGLVLAVACASAPAPRARAADCPAPGDEIGLWTGAAKLRGSNVFMGRNPEGGPGGFGDGGFSQADFDALAKAGANYVQISHAGLFAERPPFGLDQAAEANLDRTLDMVAKAGMFAVIAIRSGPGRNEDAITGRKKASLYEPIWGDAAAQDAWVGMMKHIAARYKSNPIVVGYDPMVEPNNWDRVGYPDPQEFYAKHGNTLGDVNQLHAKVTAAIRQVDTSTPILLEGEAYGSPPWLPYLKVTGDARTVYTVHDYEPFDYTHELKPGGYPGTYDLNGDGQTETVDRAALERHMQVVRDFGASKGVPVAVTEFGVHRTATDAAKYLTDRVAIHEGIGNWASWTWQPAGFDDPFSMHDPSAVHDVLVNAWQRNCVRPGGTGGGGGNPGGGGNTGGEGVVRGLVSAVKKGAAGKPLRKVTVCAGSVCATTAKKPKGTFELRLPAGTHSVSASAGKKVCHARSVDGPPSASVTVKSGGSVELNFFCGKA